MSPEQLLKLSSHNKLTTLALTETCLLTTYNKKSFQIKIFLEIHLKPNVLMHVTTQTTPLPFTYPARLMDSKTPQHEPIQEKYQLLEFGSFQWCPVPRQETVQTKWNPRGSA